MARDGRQTDRQALSPSPPRGFAASAATPFGDELAHAAARFLKASQWFGDLGAIVRAHRDYTGHGLFHDRSTGEFFLAASFDSLPNGEPIATFPDEASFTQWLAAQSDRSLSGDIPTGMPQFDRDPGNQRVTRHLILQHVSPEEGL